MLVHYFLLWLCMSLSCHAFDGIQVRRIVIVVSSLVLGFCLILFWDFF